MTTKVPQQTLVAKEDRPAKPADHFRWCTIEQCWVSSYGSSLRGHGRILCCLWCEGETE